MKIALSSENVAKAHWLTPRSHSLPCLTVDQVREVEQAAFSLTESWTLMKAAGKRSARKILDLLQHQPYEQRRCVVLAGPGNNGGDAFVVAAELALNQIEVHCIEHAGSTAGSGDRQVARNRCLKAGVDILPPSKMQLQGATVVVDGLLGIGCSKPPEGELLEAIVAVNTARAMGHLPGGHSRLKVISLDSPSGLDCTTGLCPGAAIVADQTLSFIALKQGLLSNQGRDHAGEILVDTLGCDELLQPYHAVQTRTDVEHLHRLPQRGHQHHKGSFGSLAVIGGASGMVGAIILAARTALLLGAGRVAISLLAEHQDQTPDVFRPGPMPMVDPLFPELMNKRLADNLEFADCLLLGPGMGTDQDAVECLELVLENHSGLPMTMDADALNILAAHSGLASKIKMLRQGASKETLVITPHPLEAARLLGRDVRSVSENRLEAAKKLAALFHCIVVLKGSGSIIADQDNAVVNCTGGPALATAGSGDVLSGAIAAFQSQGLSGFHAAACATWLHGLVVDSNPNHPEALLISHASEISARMKELLNSLLDKRTARDR